MIALSPKILLYLISSVMTLYYDVKWNAWTGNAWTQTSLLNETGFFLLNRIRGRYIRSGWEKGWTMWHKRQWLTCLKCAQREKRRLSPLACPCLCVWAVAGLLSNKIPGAGVEALSARVCPGKSKPFSAGLWAQQRKGCALHGAGEATGSAGLQLSIQNLAAAFASGKDGVVCPSIPVWWGTCNPETIMGSCLFHGY